LSTDSFISSNPDFIMNNDKITLTYASKLILNTTKIIAEIATEIERSASLNASEPLAINESELTSFPFFLT